MQSKSLGQTDPSQNFLIFSSNVTPEITIDLNALLGPGQPPNTAIQGQSSLALSLIKPEIVFSAIGLTKTVAPYGTPQEGAWTYVFIGLVLACFMGAGLTYSICAKSATYVIATIAITILLGAGSVYARQQQPVVT